MAASEGTAMLSIDEAEFTRLQTQLIDLRTANYQLKENNSRKAAELQQVQNALQSANKDLDKANKSLQRSKKAKEFQALLEETESLQQKLLHQEDDFRLQNKTLLDELGRLSKESDVLKREVSQLKEGGVVKGGASEGEHMEDLTRLRAENTVLQKSLHALQEQMQNSSDSTDDAPRVDDSESDKNDKYSNTSRVMELELKLSTEEEFKRLLQGQLEELRLSARSEQEKLSSEVEKWTEKAKKKQESLRQLQEEKETLIKESRLSHEAMLKDKEEEEKRLKHQIAQMENESVKSAQVTKEHNSLNQNLAQLRREKEEIMLKCDHLLEAQEALTKERDQTQVLLNELGMELQQAKGDLGEERKKNRDLRNDLESSKQANDEMADQLLSTREDAKRLEREIESAHQLAEKRKTLLDEMAIKDQETASVAKRREDDIEEKYRAKVQELEEELSEVKGHNSELSCAKEELSDVKRRLRLLEGLRDSHEEELRGIKTSYEQEKEALEATVTELKTENEQKIQDLEEELKTACSERDKNIETVSELQQSVDDLTQDVRIAEKKSSSLIKDLKRQLQLSQRREERLQQQLTAYREGQAVEEAIGTTPRRERSLEIGAKHSRESSLSSLRDLVPPSPNSSIASSNLLLTPVGGGGPIGSDSQVTEETQELLGRIAELQENKWQLEERVNHLESTGSALAEDVIQKSTIIQTYFMENKADTHPMSPRQPGGVAKMSPMRLVHWAKGKESESTMAEINRKMQRALEESMMKNIHLQQSVDMLTKELEKHTSDSDHSNFSGATSSNSK